MDNRNFDVAIIGAGISGAALFYVLSKYTNIEKIALVEKYEKIATLSSSSHNNSQTIHSGDIETNYTFEKAKSVSRAANLLVSYAKYHNLQNKVIFEFQKMAAGVGEEEVHFIKERFEKFKEIYPQLEFFDKQKLKEIEPNIVLGENGEDRKENIVGMGMTKAFCAMNFYLAANDMIERAKDTQKEVFLNSKVENIISQSDSYEIKIKDKPSIYAKFVLVDAGAHSLYLAQKIGYGLDLGCLPIAGNFFFVSSNKLKGKVYTVQNPKLPFAAIHGDPDITMGGQTRLGPTAISMPKLERFKDGTFIDFIKSSGIGEWATTKIMLELFSDVEIRHFIIRNFIYELPFFGKRLFWRGAKKIIPSLQLSELDYARGFGGVRPQVLDKKNLKLVLGEKRIQTGKGITFNMTPSPGATSCLKNALVDALEITKYLNKQIDMSKIKEELNEEDLEWL